MIKTPERRRSGIVIVNFEQILHLLLVFSIVDFQQVSVSWVDRYFSYSILLNILFLGDFNIYIMGSFI